MQTHDAPCGCVVVVGENAVVYACPEARQLLARMRSERNKCGADWGFSSFNLREAEEDFAHHVRTGQPKKDLEIQQENPYNKTMEKVEGAFGEHKSYVRYLEKCVMDLEQRVKHANNRVGVYEGAALQLAASRDGCYEQIAAMRREIEVLTGVKKQHEKLIAGLKKVLGLKRWPKGNGNLCDTIPVLVSEALKRPNS